MKHISFEQVTFKSFLMLLSLLFFSCTENTEHKPNGNAAIRPLVKTISKPPSSYKDTLIINIESAVFYTPDTQQLEKIRTVNKKDIAESLEHDCFFQMKNAKMILKKFWPQVTIIETSKARFLLFMRKDKSNTILDLNAKNDICGMILFNTEKDPELVDMMNVATAMEYYFKEK